MRWFLPFLFLPLAAIAQEPDRQWMLDDLRSCYETADGYDEKHLCEGQVSNRCQEVEQGGYSNLGMTSCIQAEYAAWDVLLNEEYKKTIAWSAEMDAYDAEDFPEIDKRVDTLRAAQRAWISYRDAECLNEYAQWGAGSMRLPIGTACLLSETAERTIELWAKRASY